MERFVCTHCGHHFESTPKETLVCPNCFWSTSIKKEGDEVSSSRPPRETGAAVSTSKGPPRLWFWAGGFLFVLLLIGISLFALRQLKKQDDILRKIKTKNAEVIASEAPELALLPEEQEILNRSIAVESNSELTESEKTLLANRIPLRSKSLQGLATPPWNEKEFEVFLRSQEIQYRIPLGWSYRRKLVKLFRQYYLSAASAFEAKSYLKARDEWIRSLMFPIYQGDIQKHRGVVLTMLRSYINDTLSKIGTMNVMLTGKDTYATEEKIRSSYEALYDLLQKKSWEEANANLLEIEKELEGVGKPQRAVSPPPLPQEISLIDSDIREVLMAQVAPAETSARDWESLRQDLTAKEKVVQSRSPGTLEAIRRQYGEAFVLIKNGNWREAKELLQKIDFPEVLAEDAKAKIKILDKLLEKPAKTG